MNLVGLLSDRIQSPLFNAGANIFAASSRGDPGMGLGKAAHAAGSAHQRQLREKVIKARMGQQRAAAARAARAEQAEQERRKAWGEIAGGDPVLSMMGPDKGAAHLARQRLDERDFGQAKELARYRHELSQSGAGNEYAQRQALAQQYGLDPESDVYRQFVLTGNINKDLLKQQSGDERMQENITGGLNQLATVPSQFNQSTFEAAVGPIRGDDTGGIATGMSRVWGSLQNGVWNAFQPGSTTEVRSRIRGNTEALAAAVKPLIRKPGEGVWTDADQARLVAVVGDLALSRNVEEYTRALEDVRKRIMTNFGIQLPQIQWSTGAQQAPQADVPDLSGLSDDELLRQLQ